MSDLMVKLQSIDDKAMYSAMARENPAIVIDYFPPVGTGKGYTSLELLMASFASCVSTTLLSVLRYKKKKVVNDISAEVEGTVREVHPKALEHILLRLKIKAKDLTETEVRETLIVLEEKLCPVWAMMKGNVSVSVEVEIGE